MIALPSEDLGSTMAAKADPAKSRAKSSVNVAVTAILTKEMHKPGARSTEMSRVCFRRGGFAQWKTGVL